MRTPISGLLVAALLAAATPVAAQHGANRGYLDTTCAPCRDFYRYANGGWLKTAQIPAAYTSTGAARELYDRNTEALKRVLDRVAAATDTARDPTLKKLGAFYGSCMDSAGTDRAAAKPIADELNRIAAMKTVGDLTRELARLNARQIYAPFYFSAEVDRKQSSRVIGQLYQAGLGLPDRDYYLKTDPASDSLRHFYVAHIARMFGLLGAQPTRALQDAERVMRFETALADSSMTLVAQRDPNAVYHKMTVRELGTLAPGIDWGAFFTATGVAALASSDSTLDVSQPAFLRLVSAKAQDTAALDDWRAYLHWQLLHETAPLLGSAFFREDFKLQSRLRGVKEPLPRWKRCAAAADDAMGEALGKAYVESEFPPQAKARVLEMVNNLQVALSDRIQRLTWMSDSTKAEAQQKLGAMVKKIGYPDTWRDYSALEARAAWPYAQNALAAREFEQHRQLAKIGRPVDRTEWNMSPPTVNAYYNPSFNEIVFPAGILQPPFFDPTADDATNYGAIGAVIGHEMTHGFDDRGRQFDAQGNLRDWWTADDARRFTERAQRVIDEYTAYVAVDTFHVNGALTVGENIADIGGLVIAHAAFEHSLEGKPRPPDIDGFTTEQRFFLGFAQLWRNLTRPEMVRLRTLTDPHSPPLWRVNGPVSNMPEFAKAFGCKAGDPMVRADSVRAEVW
ncbi:MAG TPA: M13 family metallopeptidase [Gemmatimonadales bacterium]|nr:M13 family metallopeptidase [Gemmatimonadales bacterium]